jgi:hypothetical protein
MTSSPRFRYRALSDDVFSASYGMSMAFLELEDYLY